MYNEVLEKLKSTPLFRERKHRSHFITILSFRNVGVVDKDVKIKSGDKITATIEQWRKVGAVYGSYERIWRKVLEKHKDLQGEDYGDKEALEQDNILQLGYGLGRTPTQIENDFMEI